MAKSKAKSGAKCKVPKTKKYGKKTYKVKTKTYTKREAQAAADRHRKKGQKQLARTFQNPCGTGWKVATYG